MGIYCRYWNPCNITNIRGHSKYHYQRSTIKGVTQTFCSWLVHFKQSIFDDALLSLIRVIRGKLEKDERIETKICSQDFLQMPTSLNIYGYPVPCLEEKRFGFSVVIGCSSLRISQTILSLIGFHRSKTSRINFFLIQSSARDRWYPSNTFSPLWFAKRSIFECPLHSHGDLWNSSNQWMPHCPALICQERVLIRLIIRSIGYS